MNALCSGDRAPAMCLGGHGCNSCWGFRFFIVPYSCHVGQFTFHISLPSLKFTSLFTYKYPSFSIWSKPFISRQFFCLCVCINFLFDYYLHDIGFMYSCHSVSVICLGILECEVCNSLRGFPCD